MSVFFYGCVTMDGYLADKHHRLDWLYQTGSAEETDYERFYRQMDVTIMGKRTFQEIERAEETSCFYPTTTNYVLTHSATLSREGYIPVHRDVVDLVKSMEGDPNIWIIGGNTVLSPLLDHDLVDCIILQIAPVLLGEGIPLFTQGAALKRFTLREVRQYGPFAQLTYTKGETIVAP